MPAGLLHFIKTLLFVADGFDGVESCSLLSRHVAKEDADERADYKRDHYRPQRYGRWQAELPADERTEVAHHYAEYTSRY